MRRAVIAVLVGAASLAAPSAALAATPPTIAKAFSAASAPLDQEFTMSFTLSNPNESGLTGVSFTDNLPAGLVVSETAIGTNTCNGTTTAAPGTSTVSLSGATMDSGEVCVIEIFLVSTSTGTKSNTTGPVSSTESGPGATSNTAVIDITAAAPGLSKFFSPRGAVVAERSGWSSRSPTAPATGR